MLPASSKRLHSRFESASICGGFAVRFGRTDGAADALQQFDNLA